MGDLFFFSAPIRAKSLDDKAECLTKAAAVLSDNFTAVDAARRKVVERAGGDDFWCCRRRFERRRTLPGVERMFEVEEHFTADLLERNTCRPRLPEVSR